MMNKENYSYQHYFKKIINLAQKLGFEIKSHSPYLNYQYLQTLFIYNQSLFKSQEAYIHISGLHGVEGVAGAEIQLKLLETEGERLLKSSKGFLMIFAINPFGFHFLRRTSLENIDLNRNTGEGLAPISLTMAHRWLRPLWKSHDFQDQARGLVQSLAVGMTKGLPTLLRLFAEGQSVEPQGIFYSGTQMAIEIKECIRQMEPLLKQTKIINVIDAHTGLGKLFGEILFLCSGEGQQARAIFTHPLDIPGEKPDSYRGQGLLSDRFALTFPQAKLNYFVQEFGVKSTAHSFFALITENKYHWNHFGKVSEKLYLKHPIKDLFFKTYFSDNSKWKSWLQETGVKRFMEMFEANW